ncbi:MAG TPA: polysaccharide biosynthesis/export family protein, partial [Phycisphaerae bacterium]|nr:polysaccharide biosynthesis/export family protein [Phycisphaerae bacterium]
MAGFIVRSVALAGLAGTFLTGCARSHHHVPDAPRAQPAEFYQPASTQTAIPALMIERPPYRLGVGDVLEIIYHVRTDISEEAYRLKPGDRVRIVFPYQTQYTQEAVVSGDGSIRALLIGGVRAAGYTPGDLELQLKEHYRKYIKDPELTLLVEAGEVKIEELKRAITTSSRGQSRLVPIKPDGTVDLPYVGECPVAGK